MSIERYSLYYQKYQSTEPMIAYHFLNCAMNNGFNNEFTMQAKRTMEQSMGSILSDKQFQMQYIEKLIKDNYSLAQQLYQSNQNSKESFLYVVDLIDLLTWYGCVKNEMLSVRQFIVSKNFIEPNTKFTQFSSFINAPQPQSQQGMFPTPQQQRPVQPMQQMPQQNMFPTPQQQRPVQPQRMFPTPQQPQQNMFPTPQQRPVQQMPQQNMFPTPQPIQQVPPQQQPQAFFPTAPKQEPIQQMEKPYSPPAPNMFPTPQQQPQQTYTLPSMPQPQQPVQQQPKPAFPVPQQQPQQTYTTPSMPQPQQPVQQQPKPAFPKPQPQQQPQGAPAEKKFEVYVDSPLQQQQYNPILEKKVNVKDNITTDDIVSAWSMCVKAKDSMIVGNDVRTKEYLKEALKYLEK